MAATSARVSSTGTSAECSAPSLRGELARMDCWSYILPWTVGQAYTSHGTRHELARKMHAAAFWP